MEKEVYNYPFRHFVSDIWLLVAKYRARFIFWTTIRIFSSVLSLIPPLALGKIIDVLAAGVQGWDLVVGLLAVVVVLEVLSHPIRLMSKRRLNLVRMEVVRDTRLQGFSKMLELDLAWHEDRMAGSVLARISNGADGVGKFLSFLQEDFYDIVVSLIGALFVFGYMGAKYAVLLVIAITVYFTVEYRFNRWAADEKNKASRTLEHLQGKTFEFAGNIRTVKSLGVETALKARASHAESRVLEADKKVYKIKNTKWMVNQTILGIINSSFIIIVVWDVIRQALSPGAVIIYVSYLEKVRSTLNKTTKSIDDVSDQKNQVFRLMNVIDLHSEIESGRDLVSVPAVETLAFKGVSFKYKQKPVLKKVSFDIRPGERIGIVGQSGVGKSTLFKLMLKLYVPEEGEILVNGISLSSVSRESLTKGIAIVPQETELFNFPFRENITISRPGPLNARLYQLAVKVSRCDEICKRLPDGDATLIGEKGFKISGGERQRIGIARAIYKDAQVILLDEATSHLDSRTESKILQGISANLSRKTLILIAHRLSTLKNTDRILVFSQGRIVQEGSFDKLVRRSGEFSRMYKLQAR